MKISLPTFLLARTGLVFLGLAMLLVATLPLQALPTFGVFANFAPPPGISPNALIQGKDGYFYGTTGGGASNGSIFKVSPSGVVTTLFRFNGTNGSNPLAALVQGSDGNFYGTTYGGGANNLGTVFQVTPAGVLTTLYSFSGPDGCNPQAALIQGSDGNFYGTTYSGGDGDYGTVFQMTPAGNLTTLYAFTNEENTGSSYGSANPTAPLVQVGSSFFGTTPHSIFKITSKGAFTVLATLDSNNSCSGLVQSGNYLYGTATGAVYSNTTTGIGSIFKMSTAGVLTTLYTFSGPDGSDPSAALALGSDGNFYGTTYSGGLGYTSGTQNSYNSGNGTVFKMTPSGGLTTLYSFAGGTDGGNPSSALIQGSDGNFYGSLANYNTIFQMSPSGTLAEFTTLNTARSYNPGAAIQGSDGSFYGPASGGSYNYGTISKTSPDGVVTTLVAFNGTDGAYPNGLVQGTDGNFYGTTSGGGANNFGTVFKATPAGALTTLYSFSGADGSYPNGALIQGRDGNFYGTTSAGGPYSQYGTVFKISPSGALTTLHSFSGSDGLNPDGALVQGIDGYFYGTTQLGGSSYGFYYQYGSTHGSSYGGGTAFKISSSGTFTSLVSFPTYGLYYYSTYPNGSLIQGTDHNFYGTTISGGPYKEGSVFKITPAGVLSTLYSFSGQDGSGLRSGVIQGTDGNLYGTTQGGGANEYGTVFQLDLGGSLTTLYSLNVTDGSTFSPLLQSIDGNLYGTASNGAYSGGEIFEIALHPPQPQTITFPALGTVILDQTPTVTLAATASSGLAVTYSVVSGPATLSGNQVTFTGLGPVVLAVDQPGNLLNFTAAPQVTQTVNVIGLQTITFPAIADVPANAGPLTLAATASSGLPVDYSLVSGPATIANGIVTLTGQLGTVVIAASQVGNTTYAPAPIVQQSFNVILAPQTIAFGAIPNHTVVDAPFALSATASSGLAVSYSVSGPATVTDNVVTLTGLGLVTVTASQAGDATYAAASPVSQSFNVTTSPQTISFPPVTGASAGSTLALSATASSGLPVSYTLVSGPATLSGNVLTFSSFGTVKVTASQAGDANYKAATSVTQSFAVSKTAQTITFPAIGNQPFGTLFSPGATATSGLPITYTVVSGPAVISGNKVSFTGLGAVTVQGTQVGNSNFAPAAPVNATFTVVKGGQTISFPGAAKQTWPVSTVTLGATASSGLPIVYAVSGVATVSGNVLTIKKPGTVNVTARQLGNANYLAAAQVTIQFNVAQTPQTITFAAIPAHLTTDGSFTLDATTTSGLPITYTAGGAAKVSGNVVTITGAGTVKITASQAGDAFTAKAASVARSFLVSKAPQTITVAAIDAHKVGDVFTVDATSSAGLAVKLSIASGPAKISGNTVTVTGKGAVKIKAVQAGSATYAAAPSLLIGFTVTP